MKTIKTKLAGFILLVLASASLFLTCDVGLGNSVSTKPPTVSITSPAANSDMAGTFTMTGGAAADTSLASVEISLTETSSGTKCGPFTATIDATAKTWSIALNKNTSGSWEIADGTYKVTVIATDSAKRTSEADTVYQIDNAAPTVMVTSPLTYGSDNRVSFYKTIDIKGEAYDTSTLTGIVVNLLSDKGAVLASGKADGTNTWSVRLDYSSSVPAGIENNTVYYFNVVATDAAGNKNSYFFHRADIYPKLTAVNGSVTFPAMSTIGKLDQLGSTSSSDLSGLTKDVLASIRHSASASAALTDPDFLFLTTVAAKVQWLNISDSSSVIGQAVPIVGSILPPSDGSSINQSSVKFTIAGGSQPYTYTKSSGNVKLTAVGSSLNFEVLPVNGSGANLAVGSYNIAISFTTSASGIGADSQDFSISSGVPVLTETGVGGSSSPSYAIKNISNSVQLKGLASKSDGSGPATLAFSYYKDSDSTHPTSGSITVGTISPYSYSYDVPASADGAYTYTLAASDGGLTTKLTRVLVVDTTAPTIAFTNPTAGILGSTTKTGSDNYLSFSGNTDDGSGSGVAAVYYFYKDDDCTTDHSADSLDANKIPVSGSTEWTKVTGTINWSGSVKVLSEGDKKLWACAVDNAGNTKITSVAFKVDLTPPVADFAGTTGSFTTLNGADSTNASFTLKGNAYDNVLTASGIAKVPATSATLSWTRDGNAGSPVSLSPAADGTWSWSSSSAILVNGSSDGLYVFTLTVVDAAGRSVTATRTIRVDCSAPALTVSAPLAGSVATTSPFSATGTVYDLGVGLDISSVTYTLTGEVTPVTGTATVTGSMWSVSLPMSKQGLHSFTIQAKDKLGNPVSSGTNAFYFDTEPPTIDEAIGSSATVFRSAGFTLTGNVGDTDALKSLVITQKKDGGDLKVVYMNSSLSGMTGTYDVSSGGPALPRDPADPMTGVLSGSAADGSYVYTLTVTDIAGWTTILTRSVKIDTTPPIVDSTIGLSGASSNGYYSGSVTFSGTANDPGSGASGVAKIQYSTDAGTTWSDAVGTTSWSLSLDMSTFAEGSSSVLFRAVDNCNCTSNSVTKNVLIDHLPPRATMSESGTFTAVSSINSTKSDFTLSGTMDDAGFKPGRNATAAVLTWTKDGASNALYSATLDPASSTSWSWNSSSANLANGSNDGLYVFTLTVTDVAGKTATAQQVVRVDTTAPQLSIAKPVTNDLATTGTYTITGSALDLGVGLDSAAVTYDLTVNGVTVATAAAADLSGSTWSKTLTLTDEGVMTLKVKAQDKLGNSVSSDPVTFYYDKAPPALTESSVGSSTLYTNSNFTFGGTWIETNSLTSISISYVKEGSSTSFVFQPNVLSSPAKSTTAVNWTSGAVPVVSLADGLYTFTITATDIANRTTTLTRTVVIDKVAPTGTITTVPATLSDTGPTFTFKGTSNEPVSSVTTSGIKTVKLAFNSSGSGAVTATGTDTWSAIVDMKSTFASEGQKTLYVQVTDNAGNSSTWAAVPALQQDFVYDAAPPAVSIDGAASRAVKDVFSLSGTATDNYGVQSVSVTQQKDSGPISTISDSVLTGNTWTLSNLPRDPGTPASPLLADGTYIYTVQATDKAGKTSTIATSKVIVDRTPPTVAVLSPIGQTGTNAIAGSAYTFRIDAEDAGVGVATVYYSLDHNPAAPASISGYTALSASNGTSSFTKNLISGNTIPVGVTDSLCEGSWYIHVLAADASGNVTVVSDTATEIADKRTVAFDVDLANPVLSAASSPTQVSATTSFSGFTGTFGDTNAMLASGYLSVSYTKNGVSVPAVALTPSVTVGSTTNAWTYPIVVDTTGHATDGVYSYTFTATDIVGKTTSVMRNVTIDTTSPVITVTSPSANAWLSASTLNVKGVADDGSGSGVQSVYVLLDSAYISGTSTDHSSDIPDAVGSSWSLATGTVSWNKTLTLSAEGKKTLWIKAMDKYGNWTTNAEALTARIDFGYDITPPTLTSTDLTANTTNVAYSFTGTVSDGASELASLTVSVDGAAATGVSVLSGAWLYPSSGTLPADLANEGTHSYLFTATDNAGNVTRSTRTVTVDVSSPVLSFSNISDTQISAPQASTIIDSSPKILGSVSDNTGIDSVKTLLEYSPDGGTTWSTKEDWTTLSITGTAKSGTFAKDLSLFSDDGLYRISVQSSDTLHTLNPSVAANTRNVGPLYFRLDRVNPALPSLVSTLTAAYTNTDFTLTGSATSNNLSSIQYKLDSGSFVALVTNMTSTSYALTLSSADKFPIAPLAGLAEGSHTVTVQVTSTGGRIASQSYTFVVDKTAPAVLLSQPTASGILSGTNALLKGTVADSGSKPSGVASVEYQLRLGSYSSANTTGWTPVIPSGNSWSVSIDTTAMGEGTYSLFVRSTDVAGNVSGVMGPVPVYIDQAPPILSVTPASGSVFGGTSSIAITGTAIDPKDQSVPLATNGVTTLLCSLDDTSFTAPIATIPMTASTNWTCTIDSAKFADLAEGAHTLYLRATDKANQTTAASFGFTKDVTAPVFAYNNLAIDGSTVYQESSPKITGTVTDATGVASLVATVQKYDYSLSTWSSVSGMSALDLGPTANAKSFPFSLDISSLADGKYQVLFASNDIAVPVNATSASTIGFMIAKSNPVLAIATPALGTYQNGAITVTGSASDANDISSIRLVATSSASPDFSATNAVSASLGSVSWSGNIASYASWTATVPVASLSDGPITVYVQATAGSKRTSQVSRDCTLDKTPPTIAISSPSLGTRSVGNLTIVGTTTDPGSVPSGVTGSIQYQIGKTANKDNAASWLSANVSGGAYSWSISLGDMSAYANSTYAIQCNSSGGTSNPGNFWKLPIIFQATDKAGNIQQYLDYYLILDPDGNVPVITITQPASSGLTFGGQQRITGTATQPTWIHDVEVSSYDATSGSCAATVPASTLTFSTDTFTATNHGLANGTKVYIKNAIKTGVSGSAINPKSAYYVINSATSSFQLAATSGSSTPVNFSNIIDSASSELLNVDAWCPATLVTSGNNVIWYSDINANNEYPASGDNENVKVQVRAWNADAAGGSRGSIFGTLSAPFQMTFNSTFPQFGGITVGGASYYSQMTVSGTSTMSMTVSSSKGISKLQCVESSPSSGSTTMYDVSSSYAATNSTASYSGKQIWNAVVTPPATATSFTYNSSNATKVMIVTLGDINVWKNAGASDPAVGTVFAPSASFDTSSSSGSFIASDTTGNFKYTVTMNVLTSALYTDTSGVYAFYIRGTDMTSPTPQVSSQTITLNADNFYPMSTLINPGVIKAGNFVTDQRYMITSVGSTDYTLIGALKNEVGQTFVATGPGSGDGTAIPVLTGTTQKIQGSATDTGTGSGPISGLSKVIVYLTNTAGNILDIKNGGGVSIAASSLTAKDMSNSGLIGSVKYPNTSAYSNYFASIDSIAEIGSIDYNGDGFIESFLINGNARDWWAQIDTTKLYDGPVTVHAVIWDSAGNATHYSQSAFVSNNAPTLSSVYIGTDINGDGSVSAAEMNKSISIANLSASGVTVRNNLLKFQINLTNSLTAGNSPAYYSVKYGSTEQNGTLTNNTITISDFSLIPDSSPGSTNDKTFTIFVYDSAPGTTPGANSQFFVQQVKLTINNIDKVAPTIDIAPFGKRWSAPSDSANGGVNTDTGKLLGNVSSYTDNVAGSIGSLLGHVEYATDSGYNPLAVTLATPASGSFTNSGSNNLATNSVVYFSWTTAPSSTPNGNGPYYVIGTPTSTTFQVSATRGGTAAVFGSAGTGITLASPDVSGKVIFRGKFADDQRVSNITVTIPGYNSGAAVTLASWSATANSGAGGLVPATSSDWIFSIDSGTESVSIADGHVSNWAFTFDTNKIATVAASNVPVTFTVTDKGGNTGTSSMNVDIVPYITDFSRQTPFLNRLSDNTMNPGAGGYYPVYQGASGYVISGFNLSASATVGSTALTVTSPSATSLTVAIPATLLPTVGSSNANLTVTTNGIASINNNTSFISSSSANANGVLFSSYLTEEGSFTNARKIYVDDQSPIIAVADFGQKYSVQATDDSTNGQKSLTSAVYADNVTYSGNTSTRSDGATTATWLGHVEYKADNVITSGRAAVSGVVTFKGKAFDNERVALISVSIPGFDGGYGVGNEFPIYTLANGFLYYNATTDTAAGSFPSVASFGSTGSGYTGSGTTSTLLGKSALSGNPATWTAWADGTDYKLADNTRVASGHVLNWNFSWDTSKLSTVAAKGVIVTFKVYDANNTPHTATIALTVDVAPYITKVSTKLSNLNSSNPSVYNRTALGRYPVNLTETIQLSGLNLTKVDGTSAVAVTGISGITASGGVVSVPMTSASSGGLPLTVNSVSLVNNINTNNRDFDKLPNGVNNSLLTDDVILDVWQFNNRAAVPISGQVADPVMKISPTSGLIGFAFTNGPLYYSMAGTIGTTEYSYMYWQASYDFMTSIAFAYDSAGHTYGSAAGGDINSNAADKFTFMTDRWGQSGLTNRGSYGGTNANRMESIGQNDGVIDFNKYRIKSPSYATARHGTATNVYLAYYDDINSEIRFRYGNLSDSSGKSDFGNFVDSETTDAPGSYTTSNKGILAGSTTGRNAGEYVSIGVVPGTSQTNDVVVMVWYDATNQCLWYSYDKTPASGTTGASAVAEWSTPMKIFSNAGQYCQVVVDGGKGIHIAAYDIENASLLYAHLTGYADATPASCTVDSYGIVGTDITLDVAKVGTNYIPYIGYYAQSSIRPKYAYLVDTSTAAPNGAVNDNFTGSWEVTLVPTTSSVPDDRINVGVWKDSSGIIKNSVTGTSSYTNTVNGYNSTNYGMCYGNGTSNGVLAYQIKESTKGYIETAQKK